MKRALLAFACCASGLTAAADEAQQTVEYSLRTPAVCAYLARRANDGALGETFLAESPADHAALPVPQELSSHDIVFRGRVAGKGDGDAAYVYVLSYPYRPGVIVDDPIGEEGPPGVHERIYLYDSSMKRVSPQARVRGYWKAIDRAVNRYRLFRYRGRYYAAALEDETVRFVGDVEAVYSGRATCAFESIAGDKGRPTTTAVLSDYQWFLQWLEEESPWEFAFDQPDLAVADWLLKNGRSPNERIGEQSLLTWAIDEEREDVIELLLDNGVDIHAIDDAGDLPLAVAVDKRSTALALRLINAGADVTAEIVDEIVGLARSKPSDGLKLIEAVSRASSVVPEAFVGYAIEYAPELLDVFVARRWSFQPMGREWHDGKEASLPWWIRRDLLLHGTPEVEAKVQRLLERPTVPPSGQLLIASYGSFDRGIMVTRYESSDIAEEEFLLFATAVCYWFVDAECGSEEVVASALAWAQQLDHQCPVTLATLDSTACSVAVHYWDLARESVAMFPANPDSPRAVSWGDLLPMYAIKHK